MASEGTPALSKETTSGTGSQTSVLAACCSRVNRDSLFSVSASVVAHAESGISKATVEATNVLFIVSVPCFIRYITVLCLAAR